jgi:hypothetical protein
MIAMRLASRAAACSLAATMLLVTACSTASRDPQFQELAYLAPKLSLTPEMVGGHEFETSDQKGVVWIRPAVDGSLTAGGSGKVYEEYGRWHIEKGNFCIESKTWWKDRKCYEVFGHSMQQIKGWRPLSGEWSEIYVPFRMLDRIADRSLLL